jgi:Na+/H+-dicarboxylate symporter
VEKKGAEYHNWHHHAIAISFHGNKKIKLLKVPLAPFCLASVVVGRKIIHAMRNGKKYFSLRAFFYVIPTHFPCYFFHFFFLLTLTDGRKPSVYTLKKKLY